MGERKVLNKYFPPDFDPSLIPRRQRGKNPQIEVRMMLPFSIQCDTCGEYMYRGKKFNSRKEDALGEDYHGIKIYRFYIKCITCAAEITFKTDPEHGDYKTEKGASRNFEPWREKEAEEKAAVNQRVEEERGDSMKTLENRTVDSKQEMDILDALDEIRALNQRHERVDTQALLDATAREKKDSVETKEMNEMDIVMAKEAFQAARDKKKEPLQKKPKTIVKVDDKRSRVPRIIIKKKDPKVPEPKEKSNKPAIALMSAYGNGSSSDSG